MFGSVSQGRDLWLGDGGGGGGGHGGGAVTSPGGGAIDVTGPGGGAIVFILLRRTHVYIGNNVTHCLLNTHRCYRREAPKT